MEQQLAVVDLTSGYGQQTATWVPRFAERGHRMAVGCFYGLEGGVLEWNGIPCYPTDWTRFNALFLGEYAAHHFGGDRTNGLVFTLQDLWPLLPGIDNMRDLRFVHWTPVDHDPCPPKVIEFLRQTRGRVVAMSRHGQKALEKEGFEPLYVPHGIDTKIFRPQREERDQIRAGLNLPKDAFVVGMVACNQGLPARKSFPEVFTAFAEFYRRHKDAILYVHGDVLGRNQGVNLVELGAACGIPADAMRTSDQLMLHLGIPQQLVAGVYNTFDVLCAPSMGEGFSLSLVEAQACGVPVIATDFTAMPDQCGPASSWLVHGEKWWDQLQSSWQMVPYIGDILEALEAAYDKADGMRLTAVEFAAGYDADRVMSEYWEPVLAEVTAPREVPALELLAA